MTFVLDCNILVVCLTSRSPYHYIYRALIEGKFDLLISTEILLEYEEVIQQKYGDKTAFAFISLLEELPNVHVVTPYYRWLLIDADPDDNKYCDCAIAGKAMYIVTEDKHFNTLKALSFPKLKTINIDEFFNLIQ
ncbi:MAG: putative toxin-antitoxin system toxin component, PIN family [Sphingobacteriales bacterium 50-39]|nr:putative toxin-antitoxin system toxin component, PIN family [Sphingobacteriales bacterium]OJW55604.1 MAG: putative toxin-antitoxin system toxin component, PIN family [Sphingobacteriales bacterium 50-39]